MEKGYFMPETLLADPIIFEADIFQTAGTTLACIYSIVYAKMDPSPKNKGPDSQKKYAGVSTDTPAYFQICRIVTLV